MDAAIRVRMEGTYITDEELSDAAPVVVADSEDAYLTIMHSKPQTGGPPPPPSAKARPPQQQQKQSAPPPPPSAKARAQQQQQAPQAPPVAMEEESLYDPRTLAGLGPSVDQDDDTDEPLYDPRTLNTNSRANTVEEDDELPTLPPEGELRRSAKIKRFQAPLPAAAGQPETPPLVPARPSLSNRSARSSSSSVQSVAPSYMHGHISRQEAEERLQRLPRGAFLVRQSAAIQGYVVSVNIGGDKVAHVKVEAIDGGFKTTDRFFTNMDDLLSFYHSHSMHSGCMLTEACAKQG